MKNILIGLIGIIWLGLSAQKTTLQEDSLQLRKLYDTSLRNGKSYEWLGYLSDEIGGRLSGSVNAERAIAWAEKELKSLALDKVWLQPVLVPKWTRGVPEYAYIETEPGKTTVVPICALGGSVPTPAVGLKANVVEVKNFEALEQYGRAQLEGKIVFYNRPMQPDIVNTFEAYEAAVNQRYSGAMEAAKYGAIGVIVRSMNLRMDDFPHAGAMDYGDAKDAIKIPAAAISTKGAALLSSMLALDSEIQFHYNMSCKTWKDVPSYNVIGEITGTKFPDEYLLVGAYLNSWDLGDGSHHGGAGVVQSMEVLRLFKETGYHPQRSIRVVLFVDQEHGMRGGTTYAAVAKQKKEKHIFALKSDHGGFSPRGFSFDCSAAQFSRIKEWKPLFTPYFIHHFVRGDSGIAIEPLKKEGMILAGLRSDSQRYFDDHHAKNDTFDAINKRELELGAATMASLVYLLDHHSLFSASASMH